MRIKSLYLLNIILTIVLLTSVFANAAINRTVTADTPEYDPWKDLNLDGKINLSDLIKLCRYFGTEGTPINTTALLLELNNTVHEHQTRIDSLNASLLALGAYLNTKINSLNATFQSKIDSLNSTLTLQINDLKTKIAEMNATIIDLETMIYVLNATKLGKPGYDSDWQPINKGEEKIFNHYLNTTHVLVYMIGKYSDNASHYIHQFNYGGDWSAGNRWGAMWYDLTETTIAVYRASQDTGSTEVWNWIRVIIWKIPE